MDERERKDVEQADALIKQRTRYGVRPKKASSFVNRLLSQRGIAQEQSHGEIRSNWDEVVGPKWNQLSLANGMSRGVLQVTVANSIVNQQLEFQKKKLLQSMQKRLPDITLKDIRFRVGNVN